VQLYESAAMILFLIVYLSEIARGSQLFLRQAFIFSSLVRAAAVRMGVFKAYRR